MSLALLLALAPSLQAAAPTDTHHIAMTRSGVRVEVAEAPQPGALELRTQFGVFHTPLDPVAIVLKSPRHRPWLKELEANPNLLLLPTIESLASDGRVEDLLGLIPLLESRLLEDEEELSRRGEQRRDELLAAVRAVAEWGERFDPLPGDLSREERIEELWERTLDAEGAAALLTGARVLQEVTLGAGGVGDHQLKITELRDGLRSKNPYLRRVAAQISGKQMIFEPGQNAMILIASVEDKHPVARDGAADGIVRVWPEQSREYWVSILLRWTDQYRYRAAWHLVDHLPDDAATPLVGAVASSEKRTGGRFEVGGVELSVVQRPRKPSKIFYTAAAPGTAVAAGGSGSTAGAAASAANECTSSGVTASRNAFTDGTGNRGPVPRSMTPGRSAKVTKVGEALTPGLLRALAKLNGKGEEFTAEQWVAWYEEQLKAEREAAAKP